MYSSRQHTASVGLGKGRGRECDLLKETGDRGKSLARILPGKSPNSTSELGILIGIKRQSCNSIYTLAYLLSYLIAINAVPT